MAPLYFLGLYRLNLIRSLSTRQEKVIARCWLTCTRKMYNHDSYFCTHIIASVPKVCFLLRFVAKGGARFAGEMGKPGVKIGL